MTTTEEVIRLAYIAGFPTATAKANIPAITSLIDLVRAEENEACAKVLQDNADACGEESIMRHILESQILAIRARRNHG